MAQQRSNTDYIRGLERKIEELEEDNKALRSKTTAMGRGMIWYACHDTFIGKSTLVYNIILRINTIL